MRIGELAEQAGVSTKAIRYYEQIGILTPPARTASGYHVQPKDCTPERVCHIVTRLVAEGFL